MHIKEASKDEVAVNSVQCDASGACNVSGSNLHLVSALILKSATDSTDTSTARGTVSTSGDPNSATAQFKKEDLAAIKGAYKVFWANKNGTEQDTGAVVNMPPSANTP